MLIVPAGVFGFGIVVGAVLGGATSRLGQAMRDCGVPGVVTELTAVLPSKR